MAPDDTVTPNYRSPEYTLKVESDLRALQDSHRLAIHQWEVYQRYGIPETLLEQLNRKPEDIPDDIKENRKNATFSMTLLPSMRSGLSIEPYNVETYIAPDLGYLFNLSQSVTHPAKVMLASVDNINSRDDVYNKIHADSFKPVNDYEAPALTEFYLPYQIYPRLKEAIAVDPTVSEKQLDCLGKSYEGKRIPDLLFQPHKPNIVTHNELLVSAARSHIAAISIPIYNEDMSYPGADMWTLCRGKQVRIGLEERMAFHQLLGSLAGLEHLSHGLDLPVVYYHVNGPEKNKVTYIGQGKEMLTEKALEALTTLQEYQMFNKFKKYDQHFSHLETRILNMLGVDINAPLQPPAVSDVRVDKYTEHHGKGLRGEEKNKSNIGINFNG